jgi:hypothetical protein
MGQVLGYALSVLSQVSEQYLRPGYLPTEPGKGMQAERVLGPGLRWHSLPLLSGFLPYTESVLPLLRVLVGRAGPRVAAACPWPTEGHSGARSRGGWGPGHLAYLPGSW